MHDEIKVKVRFCETDVLGHVNNTSYFIYIEEARVQFFGKLGSPLTADNWPFILASASCDFMEQAYFNQELIVKTAISKVGGKSFHLEHIIEDANSGNMIAKGKAVIVYFNFTRQKSEEIPDELRSVLEKYLAHA
ncbi:thioesterase family protein [Metabacillus sp. FJAT-52054]|uniref:Thioesterase family protein n=1 Tax=Metabacillus sediminis TaxID=3117746 RepID=A0ABZ2NFG6_9BACI